jgi:hypothetical protein
MMDPENFGKSFDEILQMVQDEKVIPLMKFQPNPKPKKAEGGIISVSVYKMVADQRSGDVDS